MAPWLSLWRGDRPRRNAPGGLLRIAGMLIIAVLAVIGLAVTVLMLGKL